MGFLAPQIIHIALFPIPDTLPVVCHFCPPTPTFTHHMSTPIHLILSLQIYVVRLNPFYTSTGACLFTWNEHAKILTRGPFELRIVTASKTAPEAYSSLQVSE